MATALVTGGTSGIGAAFARALAARGDDLVLVGRNADRLYETAAELQTRFGVAVEVMVADLGQRADAVTVGERLSDLERPVDMLVNNAGFGVHTAITAADTSPHEYAFDVMCRAVLILSAAAGRAMRDRGTGAIITVSSTAGFVTMGTYSAIKAWATVFTEGLAVELAGSGVTVTALCPGWVRTEFHQRANIETAKIPGPLWLDADRLVADCLRDVARGRVISLPSRRYRALMFVARHAPRRTIRAVSSQLSSSRHSR
ncbi:MAG TPA: SDR family NAD(P)-dependent oxidoreductase [Propionibacteriaceae bacterium]|nr:SDR family NAD(P)-dependent oxidoreductase [Propionibacteriaceae bacterium]